MSRFYFRQLQAGVDFARQAPGAAMMENFVYLVGDRDAGEALVVDPAWGVSELVDIAAADGMKITGALCTHYHPDHVGGDLFGHTIEGLAELMAVAPCKAHVHRAEADGVLAVTGLSQSDLDLHDSGDKVRVGDVEVELLHTPGHTPGSQCFRVSEALIAGDTLFLQGCGRVDLPGGDADLLYDSLGKLAGLGDDVVLFPGHAYGGRNAPLAEVRRTNHFLRVPDRESWRRLMGLR